MIHSVRGLVVGVYGIFVANLLGPVSLLVHVGPTDQFGTKVPVLPSGQLNVHRHIVVGFLLKKHDTNCFNYIQTIPTGKDALARNKTKFK